MTVLLPFGAYASEAYMRNPDLCDGDGIMYRRLAVLLMVAGCILADVRVGCAGPAEDARAIYDAVGIKGGFIVDLGCGAGELTAALRTSGAVSHEILDFSARVFATVVTRLSATPHPGGVK